MKTLVELHLHLDGSLRIPTMLEIAAAENIRMPASDEAGLRRALACGEIRESLPQYLEHFAHTTAIMQSRTALTRIAAELVEDCAKDGLKYVEVRFMPSLHTLGGLVPEEAAEAVLEGMTIGGLRHNVGWGLIICSMRHVASEVTEHMANIAIRYRRNGVVALDLAGDDRIEAYEHARHFQRAKEAGLHVTIHAAEAGPPERIREAIDLFRADRIGHGTRGPEDPSVIEMAWMRGVGFEACLTSNLQTQTVAAYGTHGAREYHRKGMYVCLNTDNRMLADTTMRRELELAKLHWELDDLGVRRLVWNAIEMSFAPDAAKAALHEELRSDDP